MGTEARGLPRRLDLARDLRTRSVFLFGPRQTGKTTWLRQCFPDAPWFDPVRRIEPFSPFLTAAAACRGQPIVFERLASDAAVPPRTVREYFQVLEDTLLATLLQPFRPGRARRKPVSHAKLYFFDVGVANVLGDVTHIAAGSPTFRPGPRAARLLRAAGVAGLRRDPRPLSFSRTADGSEVDFVVGDTVGIEVKATRAVTNRDLTALRRLAEETPLTHRIVVCRESAARVVEGIRIVPVMEFFGLALVRQTPCGSPNSQYRWRSWHYPLGQ